jgi:hypothetical protein
VCAHPGCLLASQTPEDVRPQQIRYLLAYWSAPSHEAPRAPGRHRGLTSADAQLPGESSRGLLSEPRPRSLSPGAGRASGGLAGLSGPPDNPV